MTSKVYHVKSSLFHWGVFHWGDERFPTACPHCKEVLYIDRKGRWQCPCCKNDFMV